jgi:cytidylate kinase
MLKLVPVFMRLAPNRSSAMSVKPVARDRALSQVAERQMRSWAHQLHLQQRETEERHSEQRPIQVVSRLIHPYVALSREAGANGGDLARQVASRLKWKVLDRDLLDYMAERYNLSRISLEFVDEKVASWFHEMFGKWLDERLVSQAEYVRRLGRMALLAAQSESAVFVGRGVQFMLPRESGLAIRIIASKKQRVEHIERLRSCDRHDAEKYVEETDRGREQFVQRYFHHDSTDPHLYAMVMNLEFMSSDDAADLIAAECRRRFPCEK